MPRQDQLRRTWRLLTLLDAHRQGLTVAELARELDVSVRTLYRDLQTLQRADFPIYSERIAREVQWRFVEGYRFSRHPPFSAEELAALELSRDALRPLEGTWVGEVLQELLKKIRTSLSPEARAYLDATRSAVSARVFAPRSYTGHSQILRILTDSVRERFRVKMFYDSRTAPRTMRRVDPYALFLQDGSLFLVANDERRREVRTFAVHRIRAVDRTDERFQRPVDFDLDRYLASSFRVMRGGAPREVRVRLSAQVAPFAADRRWHPSQERESLPDGRVDLRFRLGALEEIRTWVLGFGGHAEALEPAELREQVRMAAEKLLDVHRAPENHLAGERKPPARARQARTVRRRTGDLL